MKRIKNDPIMLDISIRAMLQEDYPYAWHSEYLFSHRNFRFDYALPTKKIAIEIQGGTWTQGKHTRGKGYQNDCEKLNLAQTLGWNVLWYTPQMLEESITVILEDIEQIMNTRKGLLMSQHKREQLENMLEDVVNVLDLSPSAIAKHGPLGTPPADLVRLVLEEKNQIIRMLQSEMRPIGTKEQ